jgi:hypothetical protein
MSLLRHADPRVRRYLGFAALATLVAGALAAAGAAVGGESGAWPGTAAGALAGCAVSLAASLAGGLAIALRPPDPRAAAARALGATGLRLAAVAALAAVVALSGRVAVEPLLVWTAISHLALLAVDTRYALAEAAAAARRHRETGPYETRPGATRPGETSPDEARKTEHR